MKKHVFGRQFKRDANERKALFKNLLTSLVLEERIKTTEAKAKAIKSVADKLVTKAKKRGINVYKSLHPDINQEAVVKLIADIAPRFKERKGGYTRIIKIGKRRVADNAEMVYLEWTTRGEKLEVRGEKLTEKKKAKKPVITKAQSSSQKTQKPKKKLSGSVEPLVHSVITKKVEEKVQKPGFFKRLITRQKKGQ